MFWRPRFLLGFVGIFWWWYAKKANNVFVDGYRWWKLAIIVGHTFRWTSHLKLLFRELVMRKGMEFFVLCCCMFIRCVAGVSSWYLWPRSPPGHCRPWYMDPVASSQQRDRSAQHSSQLNSPICCLLLPSHPSGDMFWISCRHCPNHVGWGGYIIRKTKSY